jgi:putative ABC transport system substrate-binding protein
MNRREACISLAVLAAGSLHAQEKAPGKVWKIGVLRPGADGAAFRENFAPFVPALAESGFREGRNLALEFRVRPVPTNELVAHAVSLVEAKVDAIVAIGAPGVIAAARATKTIPIVAVDLESDPVAQKFAVSLARPGGNITGMFLDFPELSGKWMELLSASMPKIEKVSVIWDPASGPYLIRGAEAAGSSMGIQIFRHEVPDTSRMEQAFQSAFAHKAQAVLALSSPAFSSARAQIAGMALKYRLPCIMPFPNFADSGGLMGYGPHLTSMFKQAGEVTAKILRGARPQDHPIERPTRFELAVNLTTAKALGIWLPQSLLVRADRVIE